VDKERTPVLTKRLVQMPVVNLNRSTVCRCHGRHSVTHGFAKVVEARCKQPLRAVRLKVPGFLKPKRDIIYC
jgi:hypothetical protein